MIIAITGTPGTGKTELARKLSKKLKCKVLDVKKFIEKHPKVVSGFDKKRDTKIVDVEKLKKAIKPELKGDLIVDSHLSHYLPVDKVIVTRCSLKELKKRLKKRNYSEAKVRENLDAEIFEVCKTEAEKKHSILEVDTSKKIDYEKILGFIQNT